MLNNFNRCRKNVKKKETFPFVLVTYMRLFTNAVNIICMYPLCGSQYPGVNSELGQHCGEAEQEKVKQSDQAPC